MWALPLCAATEPELPQEPWMGFCATHTELQQPGTAAPSLENTGADVDKIPRAGCAGEARLPAGTQSQALPPPHLWGCTAQGHRAVRQTSPSGRT